MKLGGLSGVFILSIWQVYQWMVVLPVANEFPVALCSLGRSFDRMNH